MGSLPLEGVVGKKRVMMGQVPQDPDQGRSESWHEQLLDHSPAIMFAKDEHGRYLYVNSEFERRFGLGARLVLGKTDEEIFSADQAEAFRANDRKVLETGQAIEFEEEASYVDGRHVSIVYKFPLHDKQKRVYGVGGIATDITDRKRAEEALRVSEQRFRDAFQKSAVGMAVADLRGRFIQVNKTYCTITGYSEKELYTTDFPSITHPDDRKENMELIGKLLSGQIPSFVFEKRYLRKDGGIVWVQNSVCLLKDSQGKPDHLIALVLDITERKRTQEQLRALTDHLQTIREKERGDIAREIHDDLGQTLTALSLDLSALEQRLTKSRGKTNDPAMRRIRGMNRLIETAVHSVRRITTELRPDVLDRLGIVEAIRWQVRDFGERTGMRVRVETPRKTPALDQQSSTDLFRIVQEALTNVARHAQATQVEVSLREKNGSIILEVIDNGRGIRREALSGINSFGLLGMKERARTMGAELSLKSQVRKGTRVIVELPLKKGLRA